MLLHIDASKHAWFGDGHYYDLIKILDDATSEIYYARLVEEEGTRTLMPAVREVVERKGTFCALYSDRASHFFVTPKAGGKVDPNRATQLGGALQELGVQMIPAYSPPARGRMERNYRTWQGRFAQELRIRKIRSAEAANRFLRRSMWRSSIGASACRREGKAVRLCGHGVILHTEAHVGGTLGRMYSLVYEFLDGSLAVRYGANEKARFEAAAVTLHPLRRRGSAQPLGHKRQVA